jgi:two-component system, NtrC family, nitrogen regulation sensor histidine kinase NtrY
VTLKARLYAYVVLIHLMVGAVLVWQREALGWWLFALEILLVVSLIVGLRWIRVALEPNEIAQGLADVIESREFGTRYPAVNHKEIDRVIEAYNRMLETLQHEWLRLGEQRGFLERFLAVTPIGIVIFDFDGRVSLVNPRARALLGHGDDDGLIGHRLEETPSPLAKALAALEIDETRMVTDANGRRLRCQLGRFTDRGFGRSYILIEELTAELNRSERETYEKLIRMISHEVTNTVAATNSLLESCRNFAAQLESEENRADYENALDVLIARNRNLNEFTKGFSDLVKLPEPQLEEANLGDVLNAMQTMFAGDLARHGIRLDLSVDEELPRVSMDRSQMDQVLINIIKNAAEAIERDGHIEISARRGNGGVVLSILDSGSGLDDEVKRSLFTPFFTTKKQGQGLGLTLVREILTQHGFAFSLESGEGGACFRIEMPTQGDYRSGRDVFAASKG